MVKVRILASVVAISALAVACSGEVADKQSDDKSVNAAPATAPSIAAGPPAAADVTTLDGTTSASFTGTSAAGKQVFSQCRTCHVTDAGVNKIGPSLNGIVGLKAGTVSGFNYSSANAAAGFVWTKEKLFQYLEKPQRVIPKTKMLFAGIPDGQKRADLIAYLENPS